jgi:thioredoxin reductase (NADPH)
MYDVVIIGKGPAGLSASLYTARGGLKTMVIGKESLLAKGEKIENYCCSEPLTGGQLIEKGVQQAKKFGVDMVDEEVVSIKRNENFEITTTDNTYSSRAVVIATGKPRKRVNIKGVERFEGKGVHYCVTCDGFFYSGLKVGVLGFNDYAVHEVKEFEGICEDVVLFTNGQQPELDEESCSYIEKKGIKVDTRKIESLEGDNVLKKIVFESGESEEINGLFVAYGSASSADFARKLGVLLEGDDIIVDKNQATNVEGVFAAGDCTGGIMQVATAVGQGAVAGQMAKNYIHDKSL